MYLLSPSITSIPYLWVPILLIPLVFSTAMVYRGVKLSLNYAAYTGFIETAVLTIAALIIIFKLGSSNTFYVFTAVWVHYFIAMLSSSITFADYLCICRQ